MKDMTIQSFDDTRIRNFAKPFRLQRGNWSKKWKGMRCVRAICAKNYHSLQNVCSYIINTYIFCCQDVQEGKHDLPKQINNTFIAFSKFVQNFPLQIFKKIRWKQKGQTWIIPWNESCSGLCVLKKGQLQLAEECPQSFSKPSWELPSY